jgi:hypothetical protein
VESRLGLYGPTKVQAGRPGPVDWLVAGQNGFYVARAAPSL